MCARESVGRQRPVCQTIGCREPAGPVATEVVVPASCGLELALRLCPLHRTEVERAFEAAIEAIFQAGALATEAAAYAGWRGFLS